MSISGTNLLGPVARRLLLPNRWTDLYPAWLEYAKELETLLSFAESQGFPHFKSRLTANNRQRDETLSELRVANFLYHEGFPIAQWEPLGLNGKKGEFLLITPEKQHVFVEVKSPGWEGVLSEEERKAGRTKQPKLRQGDGGAFGNWQPVQRCIASEKTYPKFAPTQPNLLVIVDDLQVSLLDSPNHVEIALYAEHKLYGEVGYFTSTRFENLGGVGIFRAVSTALGFENQFAIFPNPFALAAVKLPNSILKFSSTITSGA